MGKYWNNFQKQGGFSNLGKKFSDVGGRFAKVGANISSVAKFFSPELAEMGDAMKVAGQISQGVGGAIGTGAKLYQDFKKDNLLGVIGGARKLIGEGKAIKETFDEGKKLRFVN